MGDCESRLVNDISLGKRTLVLGFATTGELEKEQELAEREDANANQRYTQRNSGGFTVRQGVKFLRLIDATDEK